ncbi:VOC family protein [Paraconexibacter antarcticus]|uniref:VOC family protein n=1 Tax=Paraconexibacter antarcticus TaxID=2949664 RepID=A0ABY5DXW0_9ACTN|nr:VOC family protein [Paraconexibacter antarcticus]UTI65759.1 VOC family protein [Paraconexibacter antarcticus]
MTDQTSTPDAPRRMRLTGLHHVTLISSDLEATSAFYGGTLGLAVERDERNPDDPGARHVWFGDGEGTPGTLVTFLEYPQMPTGQVGRGSTHHLAFGVTSGEEQVAWRDWLRSRGVDCTDVMDRGGLRSIYFRDPDGHILEITTRP